MTGDKTKFISLSPRNGGHVTYGDNNKGKILGTDLPYKSYEELDKEKVDWGWRKKNERGRR